MNNTPYLLAMLPIIHTDTEPNITLMVAEMMRMTMTMMTMTAMTMTMAMMMTTTRRRRRRAEG